MERKILEQNHKVTYCHEIEACQDIFSYQTLVKDFWNTEKALRCLEGIP